jgi:hypothetical protein
LWIRTKGYIVIQQEFIFIGKDRTNIPEKKEHLFKGHLTLNIDRPVIIY